MYVEYPIYQMSLSRTLKNGSKSSFSATDLVLAKHLQMLLLSIESQYPVLLEDIIPIDGHTHDPKTNITHPGSAHKYIPHAIPLLMARLMVVLPGGPSINACISSVVTGLITFSRLLCLLFTK